MEDCSITYELNVYDCGDLFMHIEFPTYDEAYKKYEAKHNLPEWKDFKYEIVCVMVEKRVVFKGGN